LQDGAVALAIPQPLPSVEERLLAMDEAGVQTQVLSIPAPSVYRLPPDVRLEVTQESNDALAATAKDVPGRFKVFATLPLPNIQATLEEIDRVFRLEHMVGVIVCSTIDGRSLDDPLFSPVWAELSRRQAIVFVHPTTAACTDGIREYALALAIDFLSETTLAVARLVYSGVLESADGVKWIFAHLGGTVPFLIHRFDNYYRQFPECRERIERAPSTILQSVYFDTVTTHIPALQCALATFGAKQLVFGTDYPHVPGGLEAFVRTLQGVDMSDTDRLSIASGNAKALLGSGPAEGV